MPHKIRFAVILLLIAAVFMGLASCSSTSEPEEPDTTELDISGIDLTGKKCTIVRGDASSKAVTNAAVALRKSLQELGMTVNLETDWVKRGEEIKRFKNEIVIGPTNRPESEEVYSRMDGVEPPYDYIISVGEPNFIAGDDEYIEEAAMLFRDEYVKWLAGGKKDEVKEMSREHVFPLPGIKLFGADIGDWTMVYPENYQSEDVNDLKAIADMIYTACGQHIGIAKQGEAADGSHKIIIGTASDMTPRTDDLSYIVKYDGTDLNIGGGNVWADWRAIYKHLLYEGFGTDYYLSQPTKTDITVADAEEGDETKSRAFSISAWCTSGDAYDKEELVKQTAEAGFTKVNIAASDSSLQRDLMKWCAIYDLQIMWSGIVQNGYFEASSYYNYRDLLDAPHVWGFYLKDEPNAEAFSGLAYSTAEAAKVTDKIAFINLFPMYATAEQLGNPTYQEHIDTFFDTVKPVWSSVDIYPCNTAGLYDGYMTNLDIMATACRSRGIPFSVYLQSVSFAASKRTPSKKDLEWQTWCIKSFGADEAIYFTYMTPYSSAEDFKAALIDHDLQQTNRWFYAQEINAEFKAIDEVMAIYPKNLGAFSLNSDSNSRFLKFDNQYDFSAVLKDVDTEHQILVGCFTDGEDGYAFSVVNCEDLQRDKTATARIKTDANVTVWQNGTSTEVAPEADGYITVTLDCGEGIFCEIAK